MTNPFTQPAAQPAAQANPFGGQGGATPPQTQAQPAAQSAPQGGFSDPFATAPDTPEDDGFWLSKKDAVLENVVILFITGEEQYTSKFPDPKTKEYKELTRLNANVIRVSGERAGEKIEDQGLPWYSVVNQFRGCVGDGKPYLVQLFMDGNAVKAKPVTDSATKQKAAQYLA